MGVWLSAMSTVSRKNLVAAFNLVPVVEQFLSGRKVSSYGAGTQWSTHVSVAPPTN